jgi:hypothetical protein
MAVTKSGAAAWVSLATIVAVGCGGSGSTNGTDGGSDRPEDGSVGSEAGLGFDGSAPPDGGGLSDSGVSPGNDASALADSGAPNDDSGNASIDASDAAACTGLACQIHSCADGGTTAIHGTIYDPAGKIPLYGVAAYVPNDKPAPITTGAACYTCSQLYTGDPIAAAVSDVNGNFTITGAPDGVSIPLVIQIGKWRRQFVLPNVPQCQTTMVPASQLTLPKNGTEGDMPSIAISTGGADTLECLLTRVGVDATEYVGGSGGTGHIHIFQGAGGPNAAPPGPASSSSLWDSAADINRYDLLMLSCEGAETANMNQQVLFDYANGGGRVLASHFHYSWFNTGPFGADNLATWTAGSNQIGNSLNANIATTFAVGQAFHDWLQNAGALTNDELTIDSPRHNANVTASNGASQAWLTADNSSLSPGAAQDFAFDTPVAVDASTAQQCGRVAYTDMHVGAVPAGVTPDYGTLGTTVPAGCAIRDLTAQEKALEFIFFDASSCVTPGGVPQMPAIARRP